MKEFNYILIGLVAFILIFIGMGIERITNKKITNAYDNYNNKVEILLDSIAQNDSTFMDVMMETDAYQEYLDSRDELDLVLWK